MCACAYRMYVQIATKLGLVIETQIKSIGKMPRTIFRQKCQFKINKLKVLKLRKIFSITNWQFDRNWSELLYADAAVAKKIPLNILKEANFDDWNRERDLRSTHTHSMILIKYNIATNKGKKPLSIPDFGKSHTYTYSHTRLNKQRHVYPLFTIFSRCHSLHTTI